MQNKFSFRRQSLKLAETPLDFSQETSILGFSIGGTEPENSQRKILFEVDGKIFKFSGNNLVEVDCEKNLADILANGNTVAELLAVTDIPSWCGKLVYPIIALDFAENSSVQPTIQLAAKVKSFSDIFATAELSPVFELGAKAKFLSATFAKSVTGGASATLQIRLKQNGTWSAWQSLDDAANKICQAVQLRANYTVTSTSGSSSAQITDAEIFYKPIAENVSCETSAIYFKAEDFPEDLATCYVLVNHSYLRDCELKAFVCYDDLPLSKAEVLGTGTGAVQNFALEDGIDFDTLEIKVGGLKTFEYTLNAAEKTLSLTAPVGKEISISYNYNVSRETFQEMELQFTEYDSNFNSGSWVSRFVHRLDTAEKSKVAKVKLVAKILSGSENLSAVGTGDWQEVALDHTPKLDTLNCNCDYYFDAKNNLLRVKSSPDTIIYISYDWEGETMEVFRTAIGLSL